MIKNILLLFSIVIVTLFSAYNFNNDIMSRFTENNILKTLAIEKLKNEIYYFPAKKFKNSTVVYQPIERFDLIFVGHDVNMSTSSLNQFQNASAIVPGRYTHVLTYIGKDANGFAYAIEMNADENQTFSMNIDGLEIGGKLHLFCLGNDYGTNLCPNDSYRYGMKIYDYMWAKKLDPKLKKQLLKYEDHLIATIKEDLIKGYPFQIPLDYTMASYISKRVSLIEDGRQNGADCVSYFVSLFEEIANVCPKDIRIDATSLTSYYLNDPMGQKARVPEKYATQHNEDINITKILRDKEYVLLDNNPRQTLCSDKKVVIGIPTPDLLFNSPDMAQIKFVSR